MLEFQINTNNIKESNIFLRKLWCELNNIRKNGWQYMPYRRNNRIYIGFCNFGEVSFDYKEKGCINKLYIDNKNDEGKNDIENAVNNALNNSLQIFNIELLLTDEKECSLAEICSENIHIYKHENLNRICFSMEAYSEWDVEQTLKEKLSTILSIVYEYTNVIFNIEKIQLTKNTVDYKNSNSTYKYDYSWIDSDEYPRDNDGCILLTNECIKLIRYVIEDDYSDQNIALFIASSRELLCCASDFKRTEINPYQFAGRAEALNSLLMSTFEPLSLILNKDVNKCDECGALKYSIVKKVKMLFKKYFDSSIEGWISYKYGLRSSYLHEGKVSSLMIPFDSCYPQIDPIAKNTMLMPYSSKDMFLLEASSYVFRNLAHDYFSENL